jgi:putative transposase
MGKRHSPEQIVRKLRDAEARLAGGATVLEVARELGISEATFHRWKNQYGGMSSSEARRLKELEKENARLKKLVAEQALDIDILKEVSRKTSEPGPEEKSGYACTEEVRTLRASGLPSRRPAPFYPTLRWSEG